MNTSSLNINTIHPAIRVNLGKWMSINKKVLYLLGSPENIHFWWGNSNSVLLIGNASEKTPMSIKIDNCYYNTKRSLKIENRKFMLGTVCSICVSSSFYSKDAVYPIIKLFAGRNQRYL